MRSVNANPGKYVSIITNFGCHYTCPECIVRNNGLKMSETDDFSTQEPLNKVLCKERPEWVSVSGGGDPLFHWKDHWSFYEGLFYTAERRNVKLEMHTSYLPDSPEVQDFPLNWFERVVYHVHKFDDLLHVKRKFGEIVRVVFVVDDNMTEQDVLFIAGYVAGSKEMQLRNKMRQGMDALWRQNVPPASIDTTMKEAYRAETVWLTIRYALAWNDFPEGGQWVDFYEPMNRSDQPMPKIELKLKGKGEDHG